MNNIQKKSLEHITGLLDMFNSYSIYSAVSEALKNYKVDDNASKSVLDSLQRASAQQTAFVKEAKTWVKALKDDIK